MVTFGAPVEAPLRRCAHFNSRLRKSASLEDTFFTKWCSRLSAVLIFQNDSFQKIEFGLVCVTPTAQNCVFMLFSMFFFIVIITFLLLASTPCLFLQYIHASQDDTKDDSKLSQLVVALGCLLGPWLPQAPKCNSYIITYILKLLLLEAQILLNSWSPGPLAAPGPKMYFLHNNLHLKIGAFFGGSDFVEFLVPWAPGCSKPQNVILT